MNAFLSENLSGMKITQMFNQEKKQYNEFRNRNERLRKSSLKQTITFGIFRPTMYLLYVIAIIIVVYFGSLEVMNNPMVLFSLVYVFYQYVSKLFNPIQQLADQFNTIQSAFASSERIFEILDTESEIKDSEDAVEISEFKGKIEFKNVWFAYEEENWILKDVSFVINPKETVAFVGATGAGKTTILSLIVRNYDIQKGQILIDDMDIKNIKLSSLRKNIGQMLQDVFLFSGTIKSNIQMREDSITDEDIYNACEYVNANHFIEKLDHKYEEEVRERGNNFSSGQRQLLSFARTIVHKPQIMILDEATANIDTETEVLIQESLEKMRNIGTMLIVAHRLSTIQHSDKIVVLKHGEIQEIGNHQELLKKKGQYYELYKIQYEKKAGNSQEF
jgi:ATP-binding cassette subfamily B protein